MARKPTYTEKEFKSAYRKAKSVKELASMLNLSIPAVNYNRQKYNLSYGKPGRPISKASKKFSFKLARSYTLDTTQLELAQRFDITTQTVRNHLSKFVYRPKEYRLYPKLPVPEKISDIPYLHRLAKDLKNPKISRKKAYQRYQSAHTLTYEIAHRYMYDTSLRDLARHFHKLIPVIKKHLEKFVLYPQEYNLLKDKTIKYRGKTYSKLPPPRRIEHIKVINLLIADPEAIERPTKLLNPKLPGISRKLVTDYFTQGKRTLEEYEGIK